MIRSEWVWIFLSVHRGSVFIESVFPCSCHIVRGQQMLDKHLFELNLISYIFQTLFLNGIFWEVILKRFGFKGWKKLVKSEIPQSHLQFQALCDTNMKWHVVPCSTVLHFWKNGWLLWTCCFMTSGANFCYVSFNQWCP